MQKVITCESVNKGHPDKTCDIIADAILDEALRQDPKSQMAVECAIKDDLLMIYGEATTKAAIDYCDIAGEILRELGYRKPFRIMQQISEQSPDINAAVTQGELRAGDQGIVYGYATGETPERLPLPLVIAHKLMRKYDEFRQTRHDFFSDAKSQVSVLYEHDKPKSIATVLVSASHAAELTKEAVRNIIAEEVISPVLAEYADKIAADTQLLVNPSGRFTIWGSYADSGCTGRKIAVDSYGGVGRMGGGCFSSKSAQKMDRSGSYYARFVARNIIEQNKAKRCEISVSYGIGLVEPLSVTVDCFDTNKVAMEKIEAFVRDNFDFRPANVIKELGLTQPIFKETACFGHFGRAEFPWERTASAGNTRQPRNKKIETARKE